MFLRGVDYWGLVACVGKAMTAYRRSSTTGHGQDSFAKIKLSARKLFLERGFYDTRPQDVAYGAGVGHGTFYLHYKDKRDCFLDFIEDAKTEFCAFLQEHVRYYGTTEDIVADTIRAVLEFSDQNLGLLDAATADTTFLAAADLRYPAGLQRWGPMWAQVVRDGMHAGTIPETYEPAIVGHAVVAVIAQCRAEKELGLSREVVIANLTQFVARALAVPPASAVRPWRY